MTKVLAGDVPDLRSIRPDVPEALEAVILRGLSESTKKPFSTAQEMAVAIEAASTPAGTRAVAQWIDGLAHDTLEARRARIAAIERDATDAAVEPSVDEVPTQLSGVAAPLEAKPQRRALIAILALGAIASAGVVIAVGLHYAKSPVVPVASTAAASTAQVSSMAATFVPSTSAPRASDTVIATTTTQVEPSRTHTHVATHVPAVSATATTSSPPEPRKCLRKVPDDAGVLIPTYVPCD